MLEDRHRRWGWYAYVNPDMAFFFGCNWHHHEPPDTRKGWPLLLPAYARCSLSTYSHGSALLSVSDSISNGAEVMLETSLDVIRRGPVGERKLIPNTIVSVPPVSIDNFVPVKHQNRCPAHDRVDMWHQHTHILDMRHSQKGVQATILV